jgi:hypothetical protein
MIIKKASFLFLICSSVFLSAASTNAQGYDTCAHLKAWNAVKPADGDYQIAKEQYDTLRIYVQQCAATDNHVSGAFTHLSGAVQLYSVDTTRFDIYRAWLISVFYIKTIDPYYTCNCLGAIAGTYQYGKYTPLGYLAVMNYLRQTHPECWSSAGDQQYSQDSLYDAQNGYDPSHLPPLDSLGLGFLLKGAVSPTTGSTLPSQYLASFTSSPNPFKKETTLDFTLNRMTYTSIAVYDELGRLVWGYPGSSLEAGEHSIHLDATNFPSGTFYARISTGFGEVKTVKLVHDK